MSQIPRFFYNGQLAVNTIVSLDEDTAKHIWQVLRMQSDDKVVLTDGKGTVAECTIHIVERHKCSVSVGKVSVTERKGNLLHLCVAFTKNNSRNEWLLEKATELGVSSIIPVTTMRSEKAHVRHDRWQKILQSAILQSQQAYLPDLAEISPLQSVLKKYKDVPQKLVAHCIPGSEKQPLSKTLKPNGDTILLIGPEGDFTQEEVNLCIENGFTPVSLVTQRLRTETAAIAAAAYFNVVHDEAI
jgi:16S rRNA (uracil1498-N3)-methyltransferase